MRRERAQGVGVAENRARLMKRAAEVLSVRKIDRGLAADRGVHGRKQGGRDLHIVDAARIDRRGKARKVADHAAAEGDRKVAAREMRGRELFQ